MTESQPNLRDTNSLEEIPDSVSGNDESPSSGSKIGLIIGAVLVLGLVITGLVFLLQPGTDTARVRDIFIIFMALEFLMIGIVMIVLIVQIARLTLLLQNEIKPILDSTNQTANTLKGTAAFLSEHLVEPVLKLNQYLAGLNRVIGFFKTDKK
jgi:membrane protein implicated in regulation of membrane protease activity